MRLHSVSTLPNGNVQVSTVVEGRPQAKVREFRRRGNLVYLVRAVGSAVPMSSDLGRTGSPLKVRCGETFQQAIRRGLAEQDGRRPRKKRARKRYRRMLMAVAIAGIGSIGWLSYSLTTTILELL